MFLVTEKNTLALAHYLYANESAAESFAIGDAKCDFAAVLGVTNKLG